MIIHNGGTGHFIELVARLPQSRNASIVSTIYLGERVVVESGKVENGTVFQNMRVQVPNNGLCSPSQPVAWILALSATLIHGAAIILQPKAEKQTQDLSNGLIFAGYIQFG